ncbi:substrate-binding domain-containing protein [Gloeocapsa sp. PCC 73106]|uniref:substrate-binding domain-containing protein n=1 Tax=Gloeocapsa sp. PCC 73106 TaxID=102232 RepID=UPI0002ACFAA1|nr:substrate-binding domain-containing protein [Gloeocapsa sp. PCC 73106]ELR99165.1 ABC-type phosphate transport system, periplasmic component [Gloeocapsa sp. PCC 73106]
MRLFHCILLLGLLTACTEELEIVKPEPPPESLKMINQVVNEVTEKKSSGIEKVEREPNADGQETTRNIILPSIDPLDLKGKLIISGSQLGLPISEAIAQRFIEDGFPGEINLTGLNTAKGFELLCAQGKIDIVNASRPINRDESATCYQFDRQPLGFPIARDTVTLVISSQNTFLPASLSKEQLRKIFTAQKWSDVDPQWPDQDIKRVFPKGPGSKGGFDQMADYLALENGGKKLENDPDTSFYDFVEELHSQTLIDPYIFGILEYAYYNQNKDIFKSIAIDGVEPSNPNYPVSRTLYIYVDAQAIKKRPELQGFINYYLTYNNQASSSLGFFPVSETVLNASKTKLLQLMGEAK